MSLADGTPRSCSPSTAAQAGDDALVLDLAHGYDGCGGPVAEVTSSWSPPATPSGAVAAPSPPRRHWPPSSPGRALPVPVGSVVDPACGTGALLRAALDRLVALGVAPAEALPRLYGVDADPVAARCARRPWLAHARRIDPGLPAQRWRRGGGRATRLLGAITSRRVAGSQDPSLPGVAQGVPRRPRCRRRCRRAGHGLARRVRCGAGQPALGTAEGVPPGGIARRRWAPCDVVARGSRDRCVRAGGIR